jgi:hypothetical protein
LVTPEFGPGREKSDQTRYLEVCDLSSVSKLVCASYFFAHFYEAMGASTRIYLTHNPVETKHPRRTCNDMSIKAENQSVDGLSDDLLFEIEH